MNNKTQRTEVETALSTIFSVGKHIIDDAESNIKFGWNDLNIGDAVYFKTYDDDNDIITISKGEIIEIITSEKKVIDKPDDNMQSNGWHTQRNISYKIRWNGMTSIIDSRYVYTDKLYATVTAILGTIESYLK